MSDTNPTAETPWAIWLRDALGEKGMRAADLVRRSEGAIKRDRVSKWLNRGEAPTYRNAQIVANILEMPQRDALLAAGFAYVGDATADEGAAWAPHPQKTTVGRQRLKSALHEYSTVQLLEEVQRRLAADASHTTPPHGQSN